MAARSTRVWLHNETPYPLIHDSDSLQHGIWTDPWQPKAQIAPGGREGLMSESDGFATGTEGRARYRIGDTGHFLDVHWDNPFVGTNFYEQGIDGPFGLYFEGGKGDDADVTYSLIPDSRVVVPGFLPSRHGFEFSNSWPDVHITSLHLPDPFADLPIGNASWGLCGGMAFASRDYFESGLNAPRLLTRPTGEGDPLFDYIVRRLAQSLGVDDVAMFATLADPLYPDTDDVLGDGRDWKMAHVAWPEIRRVIDSGHPCPIGIVIGHLPTLKGLGHQVCVYAYELQGQVLTLWVYDPNTPGGDSVIVRLDISRTDQHLIDVTTNISVSGKINSFFVQHYEQRDPLVLPTSHSESGMGASARDPDQLDLFWVGPDRSVRSTWWRDAPGLSWGDHHYFSIAPAGAAATAAPVASLARSRGHLDVFWIGPDGAIGSTWWDAAPGSSWGDHQPFPITPPGAARPDSPIVAVARTPDHMDVFWIGPDGAIGSTWWDAAPGCNWGDHQPFPITPPGAAGAASGLTAVSRARDQLDVFWVGPDGGVGSTWWNAAPGSSWPDHQPFGIAPPGAARLGAGIASVARTSGQLDVFWVGPDGGIGSTWWNAAPGYSWADHRPFGIAPPGAARALSPVVAIARTSSHLDVFWVGPDGGVGSTWWDAAPRCSWGDHQPFGLAPPGAVGELEKLAAVTRTAEHLDVFWVGPDGAIGSTWWDAAPRCNWGDHQPFGATPPEAAGPWSPLHGLGVRDRAAETARRVTPLG